MAVWFSIGFLPKSPETNTFLYKAQICNVKDKDLELLSQKEYTFENCTVLHKEVKKQYTFENCSVLHKEVKNQYTFESSSVLHKEVKNNTLLKTVLCWTRKSKTVHFWKLYCFTQGSQKQYTFENDIALHKEAKNNTLDTYTRHLHETLTLDTYTKHLQ